jgi:hypothetical protein
MKRRVVFAAMLAIFGFMAMPSFGGDETVAESVQQLTPGQLIAQVRQLEKKDVTLMGTIIGTCIAGCKMWVAEEDYKEGDPIILVRAKDDAFKFDTRMTGKRVVLKGFALASYVDKCVGESGAEPAEADGKQEPKGCEAPVRLPENRGEDGALRAITFFATSVEPL